MRNLLRTLFSAFRKKEQMPQQPKTDIGQIQRPKTDIRHLARQNMAEDEVRQNHKAREEGIKLRHKLEKLFRSIPNEAKNGICVDGKLSVLIDSDIYVLFLEGSCKNNMYKKELDEFLIWMKNEYNVYPEDITVVNRYNCYYVLKIDLKLSN